MAQTPIDRLRLAISRAFLPRELKKAPFLWPSYTNGVVTWGLGNFLSYINDGFNLNPLIYSAIMYKVRAAAQVRLRAYSGDPDSPEILPYSHPLSRLLQRPNPYQSFAETHGLITTYLSLSGNAYLFIDREGSRGGVPNALYPLRPDRVYLIPGEGTIKGWLYRPPTYSMAEGLPILPEDMIHIKFPNPGDEYEGLGYGLSPLSAAAQSANIDNQATRYLKLFFDRGAMPAGLLKFDIPMTDEAVQEIKRRWRDIYGGVDNWTDIGVIDQGADYQKLGQDFSKLGMDQMDARDETRILGPFGVPPILLNTKYGMERSTLSNYEEARKAFWQDTMAYELKLELDAFQYFLQGDGGVFVDWDKSEVPALKVDYTKEVNAAKVLFDMGVPAASALSTVGVNIKDLPAGDVAFFSGSLVPWQGMPDPKPAAPGTPPAPGKPVPTSDVSVDNTTDGQAEATSDTRKGSRHSHTKKTSSGTSLEDDEAHTARLEQKKKWTAAADKQAQEWEDEYRSAANSLFREDERAILAICNHAKMIAKEKKATISWTDVKKDVKSYLEKESTDAWRHKFVPLVKGTVTSAGKEWGTQLGVQFDVRNLEAESWFQDYTLTFAKPIAKTTEDAVYDIIGRGMADGLSNQDVQNQIASYFGGIQWRAEMIARTETIRAYNAGSQKIFSDWGLEEKEWSSAHDDRTRPTHLAADGQTVAIGKSFTVGGYKMDYPGDASHGAPPDEFINCRCSLLPAGDISNLSAKPVEPEPVQDVVVTPAESRFPSEIDFMDKTAKDKWENYWSDTIDKNLAREERNGVTIYTGSSFRQINQYLRTGQIPKNWDDRTANALTNTKKAIDKMPPLDNDLKVRRASVWAMFGIKVEDLPDNPNYNEILGPFVGTSFTDKGFVSTTPNLASKNYPDGVQLIINVPKGSKGIYAEHLTQYPGEEEFILPPGGKFKITKIVGEEIHLDYEAA